MSKVTTTCILSTVETSGLKAAHSVAFPALRLSSETTGVTAACRGRRAAWLECTRPPRGRRRSPMLLLRGAPKRQQQVKHKNADTVEPKASGRLMSVRQAQPRAVRPSTAAGEGREIKRGDATPSAQTRHRSGSAGPPRPGNQAHVRVLDWALMKDHKNSKNEPLSQA